MKTRRLAAIVLIFIACSVCAAQTSSKVTTDANRKWASFWQPFSAAIKKKDVDAIKKTMPADFFDGGGGMTPSEWLSYINENERNGSWKDIQRSMARGAITSRTHSTKGIPTRVTRDNAYYFEFRKGQWYFAGVMGD